MCRVPSSSFELNYKLANSPPTHYIRNMEEKRRGNAGTDRRARRRGGRRDGDGKKAWYLRRPLWLATASAMFVGWRRVRTLGRRTAN